MRVRAPFTLFFAVILLIVFTSQLGAQAAPQTKPAPAAQPPATQAAPRIPGMGAPNPQIETKANDVPATATVITIEGYCQDPAAKPCQTTITKDDFEKLAKALDPNMQAQGRQSLADQYSKIAVVAAEARKHNLESDPRTVEVMRFLQMQILANLYNQKLMEQAKEIPAAEIEKYYNGHKADFEEATVRRIYIPKNVPPETKKPTDADRAALAADIDKRAKAGEDFSKLQTEVFDKLSVRSSPPPTDMGAQRRSSFSPDETAVIFALQPKEVSDVISNPVGDFIYKVESKRTLTVDEARNDIQNNLQRERYNAELTAIFAPVSVKLNPDYFGANAAVSLPGRSPEPAAPMPAPRPASPSPAATRPAVPPSSTKPATPPAATKPAATSKPPGN